MITALSVQNTGELKLQSKASVGQTPPLAVGEVVEATVTARQGGKFLVTVKGIPLEASSGLPLGDGQKITVRIGQLHPQILMIPVNGDEAPEMMPRLAEHVRLFKQDPAMLKNIFKLGKDILASANMDTYQRLLPGTDLRALKDRFASLFFPRHTLEEYAGKLGLLHEHAIAAGRGTSDNLKAMLMRLQEDIVKAVSNDSTVGPALGELADFASSAVGRIEIFQAVNLLSMEKDGLFFLPFPFLARNEIRTGEFFAAKKETAQGQELRAVLFLDMDRLGEVMVEARLAGGSLKCTFRCEDQSTRDLLSEKIPRLKEGLEALGYQANDIRCYHEKAMDAAKREILEEMPAYSTGALNIKV